MLDSHAKKQIEEISHDILKHSKALDIFPTPIDKIVSYSTLIVETGINLSEIKETFFSKFTGDINRILSKVRGILHRSEKIIYLDLSQQESRQSFVKLHEVGHHTLPWQKATLDCIDDDETLDNETNEQFEAEANFFASATLFQNDRFLDYLENLELSINSALALAKKFGASNHAALRRYVEYSKKRCALLVIKKMPGAMGHSFGVRNYFQSQTFTEHFGLVNWPEQLDFSLPFVMDYRFNKRHKLDGSVSLATKNGNTPFCYHFFNNTYNGFVFLFPVGEKNKSKTKFIITNAD